MGHKGQGGGEKRLIPSSRLEVGAAEEQGKQEQGSNGGHGLTDCPEGTSSQGLVESTTVLLRNQRVGWEMDKTETFTFTPPSLTPNDTHQVVRLRGR